jgi:hypothetical protein
MVAGWWKFVWRRTGDTTVFTAWFHQDGRLAADFCETKIVDALRLAWSAHLPPAATVAVQGLTESMHARAVRAATSAEDDATARVSQFYGWLRVAAGGATVQMRYFNTKGSDYALAVLNDQRQSDEDVDECARFMARRVALAPQRGSWRFSWLRESDRSFTVLARFTSAVPQDALETPLLRVDLSTAMSAQTITCQLRDCDLSPAALRSAVGVGIAALGMEEVRRLEAAATPVVI